MTTLNYTDVGITEPEEGIIEFEVTPEYVEEIRSTHVKWKGDKVYVPCSPGGAVTLQIFLKTGKFKAAKFRATKFQQNWKEYKENAKRKAKSVSHDTDEA